MFSTYLHIFFNESQIWNLKLWFLFSRAFAADFAEEERERDRKEAEAKDIEHNKMFKDAFERIKQVLSIVYIKIIYVCLQKKHLFL